MKQYLRILFTAILALPLGNTLASANSTDDAKTFFTSAEVKFGNNDFKGAIADYTKAIELNPKFADAYNSRAAAEFSTG